MCIEEEIVVGAAGVGDGVATVDTEIASLAGVAWHDDVGGIARGKEVVFDRLETR